VSNNGARQVFDALWAGEAADVDALIEAKGLKQMNDSGALEAIVDEVLAANARSVEEFRAGKDKAFNALVGQVMKASKGKANPAQANELLRRKLVDRGPRQRYFDGGGWLPLPAAGSGPIDPGSAPAHSLRRRASSAS
jgi:Asp-tRNA(Asn)/Glu-tRNA(Gln) amidotransferase B subunit